MKQCQDCGSVMQDGFRFCPQCCADTEQSAEPARAAQKPHFAAHYCGKCGAKLPEGCKFCLICGTGAGVEPLPPPSAPEEKVLPPRRRKVRTPGRIAALLSLLLVIAAVGTWSWESLPYLLSTDRVRADNAILYIKDDDTLRLKSSDAAEPVTIAEGFSLGVTVDPQSVAQYSHNGQYLAYLDKTISRVLNSTLQTNGTCMGNLYLLDLASATRPDALPEEAVLLAEGVTDHFYFSGHDDYLIYLKADGQLYATDYEETWQLDSGVTNIIDVGERQLLYERVPDLAEAAEAAPLSSGMPRSSERMRELWLRTLDGTGQVFVDEVEAGSELDWTPDFERIAYRKLNPTTGGRASNQWDILLFRQSLQEWTELADKVTQAVDVDASAGIALYTRWISYSLEYGDFIDDDMLLIDEEMQEPDMSEYPALQAYYEEFEEFPEEWDIIDGQEEEMADLIELMEEHRFYSSDVRDYEEMLERQALRESLRRELTGLADNAYARYELVWSDGVEEQVLSDQVSGGVLEGSASARYAIFCTQDFVAVERVKISRLRREADFSLTALLGNAVRQTIWYVGRDREPASVWGAEPGEQFAEVFLDSGSRVMYFQVQKQDTPVGRVPTGTLFYCPIDENGRSTLPAVMARDVQYCYGDTLYQNKVLYLKDYRDNSGSLYAQTGTAAEQLSYAAHAEGLTVQNSGRTLLYYENYVQDSSAGDLYLTNQQKRLIATDVGDYYYRGDNLIYLLKSRQESGKDLYAYGNGVLALVDEGVTQVLSMEENTEVEQSAQ